MALDIDLIGVIVAACISSLFIIALVTLLACKSCKILNKHREERLLNKLRQYRPEWSMFQTETTDTASESGYSDQAFKIANYTPKILRRSISQEQIFAHGKHDRKLSKRNERHMQYSYSNGEQKPKAMSVIHISGKENGAQHPQENGSVTQKSPNHTQDYVVQTEVHQIPENGADVERGRHVLTENGDSRAEGHRLVTQKPVTGQTAHEYEMQDDANDIYEECVPPEGHSIVDNQNLSVERDEKVMVNVMKNEKMIQNHVTSEETTQESFQTQSLSPAMESAPSIPVPVPDTHALEHNTRLYNENSQTATHNHPQATHIILSSEERVGNVGQYQAHTASTTAFSSNEITTRHLDTSVGSGHAHNDYDIAAIHNVYPRHQTNVQTKQHYNKKGIRRKPHDEHASLPVMWTLREQSENSSSLNIDENKSPVVNVTNGVFKPESHLSNAAIVGDNVGNVDTGYATTIEAQNKDSHSTTLGNAKPETTKGLVKNMVFNINRQSLDESENVASTTSNTAMKAMRMRRMVNESAEKIPPVFTSTPRLPPEAPDSLTSGEADRERVETNSRRQRLEHDGSIHDLPPPPSDWLPEQGIQ